ncbi:MAG: phosphoglycerate dehydrogenase [Microscillaceae bacterium]|nr:phosphoglycerate dehydrogenase [Microscillaceae bacterium]
MDKTNKYIVIDFDSTFTKVEGLDELAEIALTLSDNRDEIVSQIREITSLGMEGKLSFSESLLQRIQLLKAHRNHLPVLVEKLRDKVSDSFQRNKHFLTKYADYILIVSNGFKEFITPIVTEYGIKPENIYANSFLYDEQGNIIGYDQNCFLAQNKGKVHQLKALNLQGDVYVIGDGYTDYEIREAGLANKFFAFTENVSREIVSEKADHITPSLEEFLYVNKLPMAISYPKNRIHVLLLENIHSKAEEIFLKEGYNVEVISHALSEDELSEKIQNVSILGIRSKTRVTAKVLENANKLMLVGAFCIGTNQIDLNACLSKGVVVFNAPYSNTRSVVELAIGEMIMLMRNIPDVSHQMHQGVWNKSAKNSNEIRGKKLGIVGYGNIGSQLSVLAEALGMEVYYYDIVDKLALGNARQCRTLEELFSTADIISLHVDGRPDNKNIIGAEHFAMMKDGVIFMNLSRGFVVDIKALKAAIERGKVRGVSVDVFPKEPKSNQDPFISELQGLPNVILTPHIGGSTQEAQANIAQFVPDKMINYVNKGNTYGSVNFPNLQLPEQKNAHRLLHVHKNVSGILAKINQVFADNQVNILGQYLNTNEQVGYVITDVDKEYNKKVITELKNIPNTIKFRVLY